MRSQLKSTNTLVATPTNDSTTPTVENLITRVRELELEITDLNTTCENLYIMNKKLSAANETNTSNETIAVDAFKLNIS